MMRTTLPALALLLAPVAAAQDGDTLIATDPACVDSDVTLAVEVTDKASAAVLFEDAVRIGTSCEGVSDDRATGLRTGLAGRCLASLGDAQLCDAVGHDATMATRRVDLRSELAAIEVDLDLDVAKNDGVRLELLDGRELRLRDLQLDGTTFSAESPMRSPRRVRRSLTALSCQRWGHATLDGAYDDPASTLIDATLFDTELVRCHAPQADYEVMMRIDATRTVTGAAAAPE